MVLKLYGHPMSTCTKRVAVVLKETNTPFEFEVVDIFSASSFHYRSTARAPLIAYADRG
jgi:glutathione S-transferase